MIFLKKRAADEHHQPVAIHRDGLAGRGHIIKGRYAVAEPAPERLQTIEQDQENFSTPEFANVLQGFGEARVNMVALDTVTVRRLLPWPAAVAAEAIEHKLDHVALAVVRRRRVGKYK